MYIDLNLIAEVIVTFDSPDDFLTWEQYLQETELKVQHFRRGKNSTTYHYFFKIDKVLPALQWLQNHPNFNYIPKELRPEQQLNINL